MATAKGLAPTEMVATSVLIAVSMTETVLSKEFVTYARVPSGVMATPTGNSPTGMVATAVLVAVLMTETVLSDKFVT